MKYFDSFPTILYRFEIDGKQVGITVKDIVLNARVRAEILSNATLYDLYDISEGDTPEILAEKIYGDPNLNWVIMLANDKYNLYEDFPLREDELYDYVTEKYGEGKEEDIHVLYSELHYEDSNGNVVDRNTFGAKSVSNLEYERRLNESKRRIKVIAPAVVARVIAELSNIFKPTVPVIT